MRPRKPLLARMASLLSVPEEFLRSTINEWKSSTPLLYPCIEGPRLTHHDGRAQPLVRVLFELILGEPMHPTWRLRRLCANLDCCQPHHFEPEMIFRTDGRQTEPLPPRALIPRDFMVLEQQSDPEEVVDTVLMYEDGRTLTPEQLVERCGGAYSADEFITALARIRAEGL